MLENGTHSPVCRASPSKLGATSDFIYRYRAVVRDRLQRLLFGRHDLCRLIERLETAGWSNLFRVYHTSGGVVDTAVGQLELCARSHHLDWLNPAMEIIANSLAPQQGQVSLIPIQPSKSQIDILNDSMKLLQFHWPRGHSELRSAIDRIVYVTGDGLISCSIPSYFGCAFLSVKHAKTVASTLELLVHESAHHALSARQRFVRYSDGIKRPIASPLRQDPRDQEAVLHAAFVSARVSFVMHTVLRRTQLENEFEEIRERNLDVLGMALPTLQSTAGWTKDGIDLLKRLNRYWCWFSSESAN